MTVEEQVRFALGDLVIQTIVMKARIAELEAQVAALTPKEKQPNG